MRKKHRQRKYNKQKRIIIISLFLIITSLSIGYAAFSTGINLNAKGNISTTPSSCFTISDNGDGTGTITNYDVDTCGTKVKIPSKINNLTITKIGDGTSTKVNGSYYNTGPFVQKKIETVIFPDTMIYIGEIAFFGNKLTKVTIPSSVKVISWQAFACNNIKNLSLNDGLETIGNEAFSYNDLKTIRIPNSVTSLGSGGAFNANLIEKENAFIYNRNNDGSIDNTYLNSYGNREVNDIVFPSNIKILGFHSLYALYNLTELNIPDTIEKLDNQFAYNNKNLTTVNIGSGIKEIESNAFYGIGNQDTLTININRKENAIAGAPWGATNATINWTGTK